MAKVLPLMATALATCAVLGCSPDVDPSDAAAIDEYIMGLPGLPIVPEDRRQLGSGSTAHEGDYDCIETDMSETRQYDRVVAYAANTESLWPGAIVNGDSVYSGLFSQMSFRRRPATISVSLESLDGRRSAVLKDPNLSSFREALGEILEANVLGATPANLYSEIEEVHSGEQLSLALGVDVSLGLGTVGIASSFDWQKEEVRSRYLVKFIQNYYTVDLDVPISPSEFLASDVTLDEVQARMKPTNQPVYVSSITYGRLVVFSFESEFASDEMNAALEFAYSGGVDISGDTSLSYKEMISRSKITAFILGGSGQQAVQTIDSYESLMDFIKSGGNYSKDSPGAPIAYKLAYMKDNAVARLSYTTEYKVKDCNRVSQKVRVVLNAIEVETAGDGDGSNDLELYGSIWVEGDTSSVLLDKDASDYVRIRQGESWPNNNFISEAVVQIRPEAGSVLRLRANLSEYDLIGDDAIGDEGQSAPFESGWRRASQVLLTGSGSRVRVHFTMSPI
jgi:thiol-activated cytolysin